MPRSPLWLPIAFLSAASLATPQQDPFEREIRPLLAAKCASCHGAKTAFAGLRLDRRQDAFRGAESGPVIIPGNPSASRLIAAIQGRPGAPKMPPGSPLSPAEIEKLIQWVQAGAPWPQDDSTPSPAAFDLEQRRRDHWAWQPLRPLPGQLLKLNNASSPEASPLQLLRRATFDLTGLPPSPAEISAYLARPDFPALLDRLLASPRFGERMARRWMDLIRYSDSHGSEGDPDLPNAWMYRDYLIRAFNDDIPYNQLIREHLAGDLLPHPRLNSQLGLNESLLAMAHWRMVEHGFQPVDPWEDRVKWTDNQIDVFSKTFQGITLSCARCHDHKFDAISQKDYYAVFGIFAGARPTQIAVDSPALLHRHQQQLTALKQTIRTQLATLWATTTLSPLPNAPAHHPLHPLANPSLDYPAWLRDAQARQESARAFNTKNFTVAWTLPADFPQWRAQGLGPSPAPPGEFAVLPSGNNAISGLYPAGVYSHLLSSKHGAVIQSPRFRIDSNSLSLRMLGNGFSFAQLIIENYSVPRGGIYNQRTSGKLDQMGWYHWDLTFWKGFSAYLEFSTLEETTHPAPDSDDSRNKRKLPPPAERDGRSWFGAAQILFHDKPGLTPQDEVTALDYAVAGAPANPADYPAHLQDRLRSALAEWRMGNASPEQAAFLDSLLRSGALPNHHDAIPAIAEYRRLEAEIPIPRRAPGILEEAPSDHPLLIRGDHKRLGPPVPRAYLQALHGQPRYPDPALARLALAEEVASPANPLTARVLVNRLYQYCFRSGLVSTPDNFGKLGSPPSDPQLLDALAADFISHGWSIKSMLRRLMLSPLYRRAGLPLRRLEAEEVRDAILAASGRLDLTMFGPPVPVFYAHQTGATKGDRPKGPLDGDGRRAVYLEIRRNATNPFLEVFDVYKPTTTRGQRDVTNVPSQSLALLNSPFVLEQARFWAASPQPALETLYLRSLGRPPSPEELQLARDFLSAPPSSPQDSPPLAQFAQALWNLKEFLYVR
jgi:hypothetical protein